MRLYKFFADGKSQAKAVDRTRFRQPLELLKDPIGISFRNATASIRHFNFQFVVDYSAA